MGVRQRILFPTLLLLVVACVVACGSLPGDIFAQSAESSGPKTSLFPIVSACVANPESHPQCAYVDAKAGYAILKDQKGDSQLLLVATQRRWGIDDPHIESADEPNYFEEAWKARRCIVDSAGQPAKESEISIAINSKYGRSDGQLHVHIDILKPDIAARFHPGIRAFEFEGHNYAVEHYETIHGKNLFADLQRSLQPGDEMANHTIVVIEDPAGGFFVLNDRMHGLDRASGEELQVNHNRLASDRFAALSANAKSCLASSLH
jgi:CDP-diacylglycerol pyrophosphatase